MVLVRELSIHEIERHSALIKDYMIFAQGTDEFGLVPIGAGSQKGVYRVNSDSRDYIVAAAASLDQEHKLLEDYVILTGLYAGVPRLFPQPLAHYQSPDHNDLGDLLVMQYIPFLDIDNYKRMDATFGKMHRKLAYQIGREMGEVTIKTGRFSSEPHDGNILINVSENGEVQLRFCDAVQYLPGNIEDLVRSIMKYSDDYRMECRAFPHLLHQGLKDALIEVKGLSANEALDKLRFMREYSGIIPA